MHLRQHTRSLAFGITGAVVAPALGILIYGIFSIGFWLSSLDALIGLWLLLGTALVFSLVGVLALGLPLVLWLRSSGWLTTLWVVAGSVAAGSYLSGALELGIVLGTPSAAATTSWLGHRARAAFRHRLLPRGRA
jgi:hypothetical protein